MPVVATDAVFLLAESREHGSSTVGVGAGEVPVFGLDAKTPELVPACEAAHSSIHWHRQSRELG